MPGSDIKAIIFDMGGVLVKTVDQASRSHLAQQFGLSYQDLDQLVYGSDTAQQATRGEISELEHFENVLDKLGVPNDDVMKFKEMFWGGDALDLELVEFIRSLKDNYKMGMLSNAMSETRRWLENKYDFLHLFNVVFFSAEQKKAKPDPLFYLAILKQMDVKAQETIFIDDFIENIEAADKLGMKTVLYKSTPQAIAEIKNHLK